MAFIPLRTCVSCRKKAQKSDFFRMIRTPKGIVKIADDLGENGRGVYLCKNRECVERAFQGKKKGIVSHFLKVPVETEVILEKLVQMIKLSP
ncbi:YlxR family protein [Candidatus Peregrinibacteria bacterium]|nr:YlxR family protein [Candidatus Peregrinibacteria bacterium]